MEKKLVIVGNGPYARMMKEYIMMDHTAGGLVAFVVDEEYIREKDIDEIPVLSFVEFRVNFSVTEVELIMGIGYTGMGEVRKHIFERCKSWGYSFGNYIHPTAIVVKNVKMGEGNNILEGVILESGVEIGNANLFFGGSLIAHETIIGNYNSFSVKSCIAGCVEIENNCFFGASSTVRDHVMIHNHVLVGATAYVFKDIKAHSVVKPAKSSIDEGETSTNYL